MKNNTNTNTNNENRKEVFTMTKSEMFTKAHEMTKKVMRLYAGLSYSVCFAAALRETWKDALHPMTAAEEWQTLNSDENGAALYRRIRAMIYHVKQQTESGVLHGKDGQPVKNWFEYLRPDYVYSEMPHDVWLIVTEWIYSDAEKAEMPLSVLLHRAALRVAQKKGRAGVRAAKYEDIREYNAAHGTLYTKGEKDSSGSDSGEIAVITDNAAPLSEMTCASPYEYAAFIETLESVCNDNLDRKILLYTGIGLTMREVSEQTGAGRSTVFDRIHAMKDRYNAQRSADAAAAESAAQADMIAYRIRRRLA